MSDPDREPPPKHVGDYPHGAYSSAEAPAGFVDDDALDFTVTGDVIKFMWDYGVVVPLWTDWDGLVPEERDWLRTALGLSDPLIRDLREWGTAMDHLDANPSLRTGQAYRDLDRQARELVTRLQQEVGSRFTITYQPW
jgi:hypothetical protein